MASRQLFVNEFRSAVSAMSSAYQGAVNIAQRAAVLGWTQDDPEFAAIMINDVSPTELFAAITALLALGAAYTVDAQILAKIGT